MRRVLCVGFAIGVLSACASESADDLLGSPTVTTTFEVGAGPLPDVASDPTTNKAYVTSTGDDSLYVLDPERRTATIKVGKSPGFVAVDPTTQTAYVTSGNTVSVVDIASGASPARSKLATGRTA